MRKYQYDYNVYTDNSPKKFKETCEKIEAYLPNAEKRELLVDVDGSTIQVFSDGNNKEAVVYDDYDVGAVYVLSDINLNKVFA